MTTKRNQIERTRERVKTYIDEPLIAEPPFCVEQPTSWPIVDRYGMLVGRVHLIEGSRSSVYAVEGWIACEKAEPGKPMRHERDELGYFEEVMITRFRTLKAACDAAVALFAELFPEKVQPETQATPGNPQEAASGSKQPANEDGEWTVAVILVEMETFYLRRLLATGRTEYLTWKSKRGIEEQRFRTRESAQRTADILNYKAKEAR